MTQIIWGVGGMLIGSALGCGILWLIAKHMKRRGLI